MITDGEWVCSRCLDYRTVCQLCIGLEPSLIRTPGWIKDQEDKSNRRLNPRS